MDSNIQDYFYSNVSSIHGMVFDPPEEYLYSADLTGNKIWTHKKDMKTGKLTLVGRIDAPAKGDNPRWVEMHPSGNYLYVIMEEGNRLAVYIMNEMTRMPVFTQVIYSLFPPGKIFANIFLPLF
jgi:carboxy-cis,cis-muconate cyclase